MAYQDIRRAIITPSNYLSPSGQMSPDQIRTAIAQTNENYQNLAQEVVLCHNRIQQIAVTIANGLTSSPFNFAANLGHPTYTTNYIAVFVPFFDAGSWFVSSQTTSAVTITWKTATVGSQSARILIVE